MAGDDVFFCQYEYDTWFQRFKRRSEREGMDVDEDWDWDAQDPECVRPLPAVASSDQHGIGAASSYEKPCNNLLCAAVPQERGR